MKRISTLIVITLALTSLVGCKYFSTVVCGLAGKGTELLTDKLEDKWSSAEHKCNRQKLYYYLYPDMLESLCVKKPENAKGAVNEVCKQIVKSYAKHKAKKVATITECDEKEVNDFFLQGQAVCPFIEAAVAAIAAGV